MNDHLLSDLRELGLDARAVDGRRLTQADIARAFGGDSPSLSLALRDEEPRRGAPMLAAVNMAVRALRGAVTAQERLAYPYPWSRAAAGLRAMEALLPAGDERAVKIREVLL